MLCAYHIFDEMQNGGCSKSGHGGTPASTSRESGLFVCGCRCPIRMLAAAPSAPSTFISEEVMGLKLQHPILPKSFSIIVDKMTFQRNSRLAQKQKENDSEPMNGGKLPEYVTYFLNMVGNNMSQPPPLPHDLLFPPCASGGMKEGGGGSKHEGFFQADQIDVKSLDCMAASTGGQAVVMLIPCRLLASSRRRPPLASTLLDGQSQGFG